MLRQRDVTCARLAVAREARVTLAGVARAEADARGVLVAVVDRTEVGLTYSRYTRAIVVKHSA